MPRGGRRLASGRVAAEEVRFIELTLQGDNPVAKKHALQRLCRLLRHGLRLSNPKALKGLVILGLNDPDPKVRRWSFNALAQIGDARDVPFMETAWKASFAESDVFLAGLTALAHILPKEELLALLNRSGVAISPRVIMALAQETAQFDAELARVSLDLNKAAAGELRSATLLVGLEKAPENLFSARHPVEDVLGDLNTHDDPIIAQYSFWATVEHPNLGVDDIKVPPGLFTQLPPNVQAWSYRVLTKTPAVAKCHYDAIVEGSQSQHFQVREGVAFGLRDIFYDSLDVTVIDWLLDEQELAIREKLLEHMAAQSDYSGGYREEVEKAYRDSATGSALRVRLEAACRNTGLAIQLRKIALQTGEPDLYTLISGATVTNTQNFNAPVNVGGISQSGTGSTGDVTIIAQQNAVNEAGPLLKQLAEELEKLPASKEKDELRADVEEAAKEPKKGIVRRIVDSLKLANDGATALSALGGTAAHIYHGLNGLLPLLPS